jgi:hypothetical protein
VNSSQCAANKAEPPAAISPQIIGRVTSNGSLSILFRSAALDGDFGVKYAVCRPFKLFLLEIRLVHDHFLPFTTVFARGQSIGDRFRNSARSAYF